MTHTFSTGNRIPKTRTWGIAVWLMVGVMMTSICGCSTEKDENDGMGHFETDEATITAMASGELTLLNVAKGQMVEKGMIVGMIENTQLLMQREELRSSLEQLEADQQLSIARNESARRKLEDLEKQATSFRQQIADVENEKEHYAELYEKGVVARNQVEAFDIRLDMLHKQLALIEEQIGNTVISDDDNRHISSDDATLRSSELRSQIAQIDNQLTGIHVSSPITGTVIEKTAEMGDQVSAGMPLFKVADLSKMTLRAYLSSKTTEQLNLGQKVKVAVETSIGNPRLYDGIVMWISQNAEFSGKPTSDGNVDDAMHAVKVSVINDGKITIGMKGRLIVEE